MLRHHWRRHNMVPTLNQRIFEVVMDIPHSLSGHKQNTFVYYTPIFSPINYQQHSLGSEQNIKMNNKTYAIYSTHSFQTSFISLFATMELQTNNNHQPQEIAREEVILLLRNAFNASSQKQQKDAEQTILSLLNTPAFFRNLYTILTDPTPIPKQQQLCRAAAILIKKFSYDYAKTKQDKSQFLQTILNLILSPQLDYICKDTLSSAIEYIFIEDQDHDYTKKITERVLEMLIVAQNLNNLQGLLMVLLAYLNSIVELQNQITFLEYSLGNIQHASIMLLSQINKLTPQQWTTHSKSILPKLNKLFDYLETAIQRIIDEEEYFTTQLKSIRENTFFIAIIENYLPLFNFNGSLISRMNPEVNLVKRVIANIVSLVYTNHKCPPKIFNIIYLTMIVQSQQRQRDCSQQTIIINCMQILGTHLRNGHYHRLFSDNLPMTLLSLFMYSTTSPQQCQALNNHPQQFSNIAEYYTQVEQGFFNLKVKTAGLIEVLVDRIDQALKQVIDMLLVIMMGSLQPTEHDSEIVGEIKSSSAQFQFYGLSNQQKLETSLIMLCPLAPFVRRRVDAGQAVYAYLLSQFDILTQTTSPIVTLRLMRTVSCYSLALYFPFLELQMKRGRVFVLQGLKSFQKIIKTNKFAQLYHILSRVMTNIVSEVRITDQLMTLIIMNNYDTMIKTSPDLYSAVRNKLRDDFFANKNQDIHSTLTCFNLLHSLIKKQESTDNFFQLTRIIYDITKYLQQPQNKSFYDQCDQKIVELFEIVLARSNYVPEEVDIFAVQSLGELSGIDKGSVYFRFYNLYVFRHTGNNAKIQPLFQVFWNQIARRFQKYKAEQQYNEGISYFCFLISQILANHITVDFSESDLKQLLSIAQQLPLEYRQYPLLIFLTYLYLLPYPVCAFLKQHSLYEGFITGINNVPFNGLINKRIFVLSIIKLLQIEQNPHTLNTLLSYCVQHLKNSIRNPKKKNELDQQQLKRGFNEQNILKKQRIEYEKNDNELINLFVKFQHPFQILSQFDQFKFIFNQNNFPLQQISPQLRTYIKTILQTQWVDNKTRRIVSVKR